MHLCMSVHPLFAFVAVLHSYAIYQYADKTQQYDGKAQKQGIFS